MTPAEEILAATRSQREQLLQHPIYRLVASPHALRLFMRDHAFAVLDFMWLLKRLQLEFTGARQPWTPPSSPQLTRFINEIVLAEESDEDGRDGYCSHFELYLRAMQECAAPIGPVNAMTESLTKGNSVAQSLALSGIGQHVVDFVQFNAALASSGSVTQVVASFCFGREDIIPEMFQRLLDQFAAQGLQVPALEFYIRRHIELDEGHHGPLTRQMINSVCNTAELFAEAIEAAQTAITLRIRLWDGVVQQLLPQPLCV